MKEVHYIAKKRSFEDVKNEINKISPNIELVGEYIDTQTKITCKCKIHNYMWDAFPFNLLKGQNCPKCSGVYKKNTNDFIEEIQAMYNNEYSLLSEYEGANKKVKMVHNICNNFYEVTPSNFLRGRKCPYCARENSYAYTNEEFIHKMKTINPNIKIVDDYKGSMIKHNVECIKCGYQWEATANTLLRNKTSCKNCSTWKNKKIEYEDFVKRTANNNSKIVGNFTDMNTVTAFKCEIHNIIFNTKPSYVLTNSVKCPKCTKKPIVTNEMFKNRIKRINKDIEILGEYKNQKERILCKCKRHKYTWLAAPTTLYNGCGCPMCKKTKGESIIAKYLDEHAIEYEMFKKFPDLFGVGRGKLSYDFYLPKYKCLIEFQGKYHDGSVPFQTKEQLNIQQEHDIRKQKYAKDNGFKLIAIWYFDIKIVDKILNKELSTFSKEVIV